MTSSIRTHRPTPLPSLKNPARGWLTTACILVLCLGMWLGIPLACTDARLQPLNDPVTYVDDALAISGQFCTSPPEEVAFPVKILIMIDQSASLQCTDPGNNRLTALSQLGAELDPNPNVEFGVIGFASWSRIVEFTPDWATAAAALAPENGSGGPATDYQGALATALSLIETDILASGESETARSKYVILFMSDGVPEPRCNAGCDDGDIPPDSLYGVCNTTEERPEDEYVDMGGICPDYNQEEQILKRVRDVMSLRDFYGVGELSLSTLLLFAPEEEIEEVCGDVSEFGYLKEEAEPLMQAMAEAGEGTYRDVNISDDLDFLDYDYESLQAPYQVTSFFALNAMAMPLEGTIATDSDGDGLDDATEFDLGLERLSADSDQDGFSDLFEHTFRLHGFDPLDGTIPAAGCSLATDRDGDGLLECEEDFLGSDPVLPDSDGDRIPDGLELRFGLDPTLSDADLDHDFDGRVSGQEIRTGTHPQYFDTEDALLDVITYNIDALEPNDDDTRCYDFLFQNVTLVPALSDTGEKGVNRVLIVVEEEPEGLASGYGRFQLACVEARYLGDTFKDPPSGEITGISPERFVELYAFDPETDCLELGADPRTPLTRRVP